MHFEILVEDQSGKTMLEVLIPRLIRREHTARIIAYKGLGHIPKNINPSKDTHQSLLLNQLPRMLRGYGKSFSNYCAAVIVICDLDKKCKKEFIQDLRNVLNACDPRPVTRFCIAIEEGEAWLLGDRLAIKSAYPKAKSSILDQYVNDSICGTWETLADAIFPGGHARLSEKGYPIVGKEKSEWARNIAPKMDVKNNMSPSFNYFRRRIEALAG